MRMETQQRCVQALEQADGSEFIVEQALHILLLSSRRYSGKAQRPGPMRSACRTSQFIDGHTRPVRRAAAGLELGRTAMLVSISAAFNTIIVLARARSAREDRGLEHFGDLASRWR